MKLPPAIASALSAFALLPAIVFAAAEPMAAGDWVRVTKGAMLQENGRNLVLAPKNGEWLVVRSERGREVVDVSFLKDDGAIIAAELPVDSVSRREPDGAVDLQGAMDAFAALRMDDAKRLFGRASASEPTKVLAGALSARVLGAAASAERAQTPAGRQAFVNTLQTLRDSALQLAQAGRFSLALAMDRGADGLAAKVFKGMPGASASRLDRPDIERRVAISNKALRTGRQGFALKKLTAAQRAIADGLEAEPAHPELKLLSERVKKDVDEADDCWRQAEKMRTRGQKGVIHALSSLDDGLRLCADHPKLLSLRREMQSEFEGRTSPQVNDKFLAITKGPRADLEEGRKLYTTQCTECHDLEMLDTRSVDGWQRMVSGMSRRAGLDAGGQGKIVAYLAAALKYVEATGGE